MYDLKQTNMLQPLVDEIETTVSSAKKEIAEKVNENPNPPAMLGRME